MRSFMNLITIGYSVVYLGGEREYFPSVLCPQQCTNAVLPVDSGNCANQENQIKLNYLNLLKQDAAKKKDRPTIVVKKRSYFPATECPEKFPILLKFNEKMLSRYLIMTIAFHAERIFSVSFEVKQASLNQAWYLRKSYCPIPVWATEDNMDGAGLSFNKVHTKDYNPLLGQKCYSGFLRPYDTYASNKYACDQTFDQMIPDVVTEGNLDELFPNAIEPQELRNNLKEMAQFFLNDDESIKMAIIYLQPQNPAKKIVRQLFIKA